MRDVLSSNPACGCTGILSLSFSATIFQIIEEYLTMIIILLSISLSFSLSDDDMMIV